MARLRTRSSSPDRYTAWSATAAPGGPSRSSEGPLLQSRARYREVVARDSEIGLELQCLPTCGCGLRIPVQHVQGGASVVPGLRGVGPARDRGVADTQHLLVLALPIEHDALGQQGIDGRRRSEPLARELQHRPRRRVVRAHGERFRRGALQLDPAFPSGKDPEEQIVRARLARRECYGLAQQRDRLVAASDLVEPAREEEVDRRYAGHQLEPTPEAPLRLGPIAHRALENAHVDVQVSVAGGELEAPQVRAL